MEYYREVLEAQKLLWECRFDSCAMKCGKIFENTLKQLLENYLTRIADNENRSIIERRLSALGKTSIDQLRLVEIVRLFDTTGALAKIVEKHGRNRVDLQFIDLKKMTLLRNVSVHEPKENIEEEAGADAYIMMGSLLKLLKITGLLTSYQHPPQQNIVETETPEAQIGSDQETRQEPPQEDSKKPHYGGSDAPSLIPQTIETPVVTPIETHSTRLEGSVPRRIGEDRVLPRIDRKDGLTKRLPAEPMIASDHVQPQTIKSQDTTSKASPKVPDAGFDRVAPSKTLAFMGTLAGNSQRHGATLYDERSIPNIPFRSHLGTRLRQIYGVIYFMKFGYEYSDAVKNTMRLFPNVRNTQTITDACARRFAGDVGTFILWFKSGQILDQLSRSRKFGLSDHDLHIFGTLCDEKVITDSSMEIKATTKKKADTFLRKKHNS